MSVEGTTDNSAGSGSTGNVTSGTASEAMIKAAEAASSPAGPDASGGSGAGAQPPKAGEGTPGATTGATGQPTGTGSSGATGDRGPIPFERHEAALKNAREEFKWAQELTASGLKPDEVKAGVALLIKLRTDPAAFWKQLGEEGKFGQPAGETEKEPTFEYPSPDLASADGKVKAFSGDAVLKALEVQEKKLIHQFQKEMRPLIEFHSSEMTRQQQTEFTAQVKRTSDAALKRAEALPHFKDHKAAIADKLAAVAPEVLAEIGPIGALFEAYHAVLAEKVYPTIESDAEKRVRENYGKKAAGGGGIPPNGGGGDAKPVVLDGPDALAKHMERLAAQGVGG